MDSRQARAFNKDGALAYLFLTQISYSNNRRRIA
jgi:hypothetical protein